VTTVAGAGCTTYDGYSMAHGSSTSGKCIYADTQCGNASRCGNNSRTLSCNNGVVSASNCDPDNDRIPVKCCYSDCD
jgi:hypothetical protein